MSLEARFVARALVAFVAFCSGCSTRPDGNERADAGGAHGGAGGASGGVTTGGSSTGGTSSDGGRGGSSAGNLTSGTSGAAGSEEPTGGRGGSSAGESGNGGDAGSAQGGGGTAGSGAAGPDAGSPNDLTVFYLDVGGSVMATDVMNPRARTIVEDAGQGPDGIAIDEANGHLYWTGMGVPANDDGFLRRSNLDGSNVVTIVRAGGTYTPKQLKLDAENGKLYWSDREGMRVQRSNLDGSELETLVTTGTGATDRRDNARWCVGIAIDLEGGYFYWSQKGPDNGMVGSLRRARLTLPTGENSTNRSDIEVLFSGLPEPIDVDLDLVNRHIYWTDRGDDTINRAPIEIPSGATAANRTDRQILVRGVREAIGVTLDVPLGKLFFTAGTGGRVGMANLDGSSVVDLVTGTAGLTGVAVVRRR